MNCKYNCSKLQTILIQKVECAVYDINQNAELNIKTSPSPGPLRLEDRLQSRKEGCGWLEDFPALSSSHPYIPAPLWLVGGHLVEAGKKEIECEEKDST